MPAHWLANLPLVLEVRGSLTAHGEEKFWCPNMLSLVSFAGMTLNMCVSIGTRYLFILPEHFLLSHTKHGCRLRFRPVLRPLATLDSCIFLFITLYLIETPFEVFANRADTDQAALVRLAA